MTEARHPIGGGGDQRRPDLRDDLTIINDTSGDGAMRIVDPKTGKQYSFNRHEQTLCRAADGAADIAEIHARQQADGGEMTEDQVAKFFRRLHVLGLLKPSQSDPQADKPAPRPASGLMAKRREERAGKPADPPKPEQAGDPTGRDGGLMARRRLARGIEPVEGGRGKTPGGMRDRLARRAQPKDGGADTGHPLRGSGAARPIPRAFGATLASAVKPPANDPSPADQKIRDHRREMIEKARTAPPATGTAETASVAARELIARRRKDMAKGAESSVETPASQIAPDRSAGVAKAARDLLAKRRQEIAARDETAAPEQPKAAPPRSEEDKQAARDLLAKRRQEIAARDDSAAPEQPKAAPPRSDEDKQAARDLLAKRRQEMAAQAAEDAVQAPQNRAVPQATAPKTAPRDPLAQRRREAIAKARSTAPGSKGTAVTVAPSKAPDLVVRTKNPAAPVKPKDLPRDLLAARRAALTQVPEVDAAPRSPEPPQTVAVAAVAPDAANVTPETTEGATPPQAGQTAGPQSEEAPSSASTAMAAAQKAASSARAPRTKPASASAPKKAPRNSDLMVRRLRERSGRGIAPETGKPPRPGDEAAATRTPPPKPASIPDLDFDFLDEDDLDDLGGGMGGLGGGGMGGPGGGMGAMRGGMMGGMRPGLGGGTMGGGGMAGGLAGMRGGMMGGGMAGGLGAKRGGMGGGAQAGKPAEKLPGQLPLFNPQPFLRFLYILFYPFKYVLWAIVPLLALGILTAINNSAAMFADVGRIASDYSSITHLLISIFGVSLIARLAQGVAVVAHGGKVKVFGLMLALGILPRFTIDRRGIDGLDRSGQLWAYGAPLLARLTVFSVGVVVWAMTRDRGGVLPDISLVLAQFGLVVFLITAWPLFVSDGQRWLAVMLNEPKLVGKAAQALRYVFKGGELPASLSRADVWPLALFAMGTLLTIVVLVGGAIYLGATFLVGELQGLGFVLFAGGLAAFLLWFAALISSRRRSKSSFDAEGFRKMAQARGMDFAQEPAGDDEAGREALMPSRAKVVWALILCGLLGVAFLPYDYETGGNVEILPFARGQATARTDGEIVEILVQEGDTVERGQGLAQLSSWDQQADIMSTEALLEGAKAELARMEAGATPEEIDLARKQLESAEASVAFTQAEADRQTNLAKSGVVSQASLEKALSNLDVDLADLEVARANYNNVVAPATAEDLAIRRSDVRRYEEMLAFQRDELNRTKIVAPIDGRVVTKDLQLKQGSYLRAGDVFLEIERTDTVTATILVTESDIGLIAPGDEVRLKTSGQSDAQIVGTVEAIAPSASEEAGYGRAIRVTASFDNADGFLRTGMTGYAKIDGEEMRVWEAYLRSIRHFFQIEVWSWIP